MSFASILFLEQTLRAGKWPSLLLRNDGVHVQWDYCQLRRENASARLATCSRKSRSKDTRLAKDIVRAHYQRWKILAYERLAEFNVVCVVVVKWCCCYCFAGKRSYLIRLQVNYFEQYLSLCCTASALPLGIYYNHTIIQSSSHLLQSYNWSVV